MTQRRDWSLVPVTRREALAAGAGLGLLAVAGCEADSETAPGSSDEHDAAASAPPADSAAAAPSAAGPDLGLPDIGPRLWQTMGAYVRATPDGHHGSRVNLFNPADVPQRVLVQVMRPDGTLVVKEELGGGLPSGESRHLELGDYLPAHGVELPFEGHIWIGTTPESGRAFMGLQGITFDWYGPAHMASVHGMRDFGNSNHDTMWTDLVLPRFATGGRYRTHLAVLNASGDGVSEALVARPEVILRDFDGLEMARRTLDELPPYCSRLVAVSDLLDTGAPESGSVQILEPEVGLVVFAFLIDGDNGGIVTADHFFDRHFVVDGQVVN